MHSSTIESLPFSAVPDEVGFVLVDEEHGAVGYTAISEAALFVSLPLGGHDMRVPLNKRSAGSMPSS